MAETNNGHVGNFLKQSTAGLPNWAWLLVIAGGIAAAIFVPKFLAGRTSAATTTPTSGTGLGLAVDPTTGLPYATEGLVPSGAYAGNAPTAGAPPPLPAANTAISPSTPALTPVYTRNLQSGAAPPNDIPIWKTPNVDWSQGIGSIPVNTPVKVGSPVQTGTQTFYPISYNNTVGFVGAWDLAGIPSSQWPQG